MIISVIVKLLLLQTCSAVTPTPVPTAVPTPVPTPVPTTTTTPLPGAPLAVNIQLIGKQTNQTGAYDGQISDRAVDGLYPGNGGSIYDNCAYPYNTYPKAAEWWIDLEQMYTITSIKLYNTDDTGGYFRMTNFALRVYTGPGEYNICAEYPGIVSPGGSVELTCADNVYGQYVQFIRLGSYNDIHLVTICEVEIMGRLYPVLPHYTDEQMMASRKTSDTLAIHLEQVTVPPGLSSYYGYRVTYNSKTSDVAHVDNNKYVTFSLANLTPNTEYTVNIQPYRDMDGQREYGTSYPQQVYKTICAAPDPPTILSVTVEEVTGQAVNNLRVTYQVPTVHRCDSLTKISVSYRMVCEAGWSTMDASLTSDTVIITPIQTGEYTIKLIVTNNMGLQAESGEKTTQDAPGSQQASGTAMLVSLGIMGTIIAGLLVVIGVGVSYYKNKIKKLRKYLPDSVDVRAGRHSRDTPTNVELSHQPRKASERHHPTLELSYQPRLTSPGDHTIPTSEYEEIGTTRDSHGRGPLHTRHQPYEHVMHGAYENNQITGPYDVISNP